MIKESFDNMLDELTKLNEETQDTNTHNYPSCSGNMESITSQEVQYEIFKQVDLFCSGIFNEFKAVDTAFGNIADFFFNLAGEYDSRAKHSKKNNNELTDDEIVELALVTVGFATRGVGNLINAVKAKLTLQTIINNLRQEADKKIKFIDEFVDQTYQICNLNWQNLQNQVQFINVTGSGSFVDNIEQPILTSVNMLRTSLYHYRMMQYLQEEYKYWVHGEIGKEVMPDYGDINREIVFSCLFNSTADTVDKMDFVIKDLCGHNKNDQLKELSKELSKIKADTVNKKDSVINDLCDDSLDNKGDIVECLLEDDIPFVRESVPLILDKQLMATYLAVRPHGDEALPEPDGSDAKRFPNMKRALINNPAYSEYLTLNREFMSIDQKKTLRTVAIFLNVILFTYICYKLAADTIETTWLLWTTVIISAIVAIWRGSSVFQNFSEKYDFKMQELQLYTTNQMNRLAGEQKVKNNLQQLNDRFFMTILGFIIGAALGSFFLPPLGTFIGALLGASFLGSETTNVVSDGSGWENVKTGTGWLAYLILIAMVSWIIVS